MPEAVRLADKLASFSEHWQPRIVASFNGHDVMVVKLKGTFVWHSHPDTDDFFQVLKGRLVIELRELRKRLGYFFGDEAELWDVGRGAVRKRYGAQFVEAPALVAQR
mgnify:CR=1 FL=1